MSETCNNMQLFKNYAVWFQWWQCSVAPVEKIPSWLGKDDSFRKFGNYFIYLIPQETTETTCVFKINNKFYRVVQTPDELPNDIQYLGNDNQWTVPPYIKHGYKEWYMIASENEKNIFHRLLSDLADIQIKLQVVENDTELGEDTCSRVFDVMKYLPEGVTPLSETEYEKSISIIDFKQQEKNYQANEAQRRKNIAIKSIHELNNKKSPFNATVTFKHHNRVLYVDVFYKIKDAEVVIVHTGPVKYNCNNLPSKKFPFSTHKNALYYVCAQHLMEELKIINNGEY